MPKMLIVHVTPNVEESRGKYMDITTTLPSDLIDSMSAMGHVVKLKNGVEIRCMEEDIAVQYLEGKKIDVIYSYYGVSKDVVDMLMENVRHHE